MLAAGGGSGMEINMKQRVLSAVIALPVVIGAIYFGGIYLLSLVGLAACVGIFEFNRAFGYREKKLLPAMTMLGAVIYTVLIYSNEHEKAQAVFGLVLMTEFAVYVLLYPRLELKQVFANIVGFIYIPYMLLHALLIRQELAHGKILIWLVIMIAFGSDSFAYFTGVSLGRHKLAPILSPKKTIEGAVGGIFGSMLICVGYGMFMEWQGYLKLTGVAYLCLMILGILGSLFSQIGDLVGSAIKRETGIKDFGNLIPGHGGILDRLDSILFVAPFVYYFMQLIYRWN